MNICPKYHGFCDSFGSVQCGGDCAKCKDSRLANAMTFNELLNAINEYAKSKYYSKISIRCALMAFMRVNGLTANDRMTLLDSVHIKRFYENATDLSLISRKNYIIALRYFNNELFRSWCEERGLVVSEIPNVKGLSGKYDRYDSISKESMDALRDLQFEYRQSTDPRKWLMLTLGLDFGMSKADILRAEWDKLFVRRDGQMLVSYLRNKTGKPAEWKVTDEQLREFRRARELCESLSVKGIRRDSVGLVVRSPTLGTNTKRVCDSWNVMIQDLRLVVPEWKDDSKAAHNLRKEFATRICREYGWDVAEIATGDTIEMLKKSYVSKLKIDWSKI